MQFDDQEQRSDNSLLSALDQFVPKDQFVINRDKKVLVLYSSGSMGGDIKQQNGMLVIQKGSLRQRFKENSSLCDLPFTQTHSDDQCLVTPISAYGRKTYYKVQELPEIKNSRQTKVSDVYHVAQIIKDNYEHYQSFIVICGVATLTYVASMLSFMLENLSKTVVVTGCLIPVSFMRNDAFQNMLNSLTLAGHFMIPEVLVVFGDKAFRGNRTRTIESDSFDGIESPNFPPLVTFGITIDINWGLVMRREQGPSLVLSPAFNTEIVVLKVTPFTTYEHIKYMLDLPGLRCCVFECYHFGEIPHSQQLMDLLMSQEKREIVVIIIQQCMRITSDKSNLKIKEDLIVGYDITPEAAVAKMGYLLGKQYSMTQIRQLFKKNLQGEVDSAGVREKFEGKHKDFLQTLIEQLQKNTGDDQIFRNIEFVNRHIIPNLGCQMAKIGQVVMIKELRKMVSDLSYQIQLYQSLGDYDNRTMLHVAVAEQQMEVITYLVEECKVDINVVDCQGCTPMYDALVHRDKPILFYMIQHGGKIKAPQDELVDLVLNAAQDGDVQFLELLFHSGLKDLNEFINIDYRNAGHIAVCASQVRILKFLKYQAHFDFSQRDRWQRTPFDEAQSTQNKDIINFLANVIN